MPDPSICDRMMVVDGVVWNGDAATDPVGLTPDKVATALRSRRRAIRDDAARSGRVSPGLLVEQSPGGTSLVVTGGHSAHRR